VKESIKPNNPMMAVSGARGPPIKLFAQELVVGDGESTGHAGHKQNSITREEPRVIEVELHDANGRYLLAVER
jgi:hypothetical protein